MICCGSRGQSITVDADRCQLERILVTLDHYIIMDDVELQRMSSPDEGVRGSTEPENFTSHGAADASSAREVTTRSYLRFFPLAFLA